MRDVFFTILTIWIIYRIWNGIQSVNVKNTYNSREAEKKAGNISVDYVPPKQKNKNDDEGEYVDYEEVK